MAKIKKKYSAIYSFSWVWVGVRNPELRIVYLSLGWNIANKAESWVQNLTIALNCSILKLKDIFFFGKPVYIDEIIIVS